MQDGLALSGVKVLDLTRLLPGPYATYILSGYGAHVIKVEDLGMGDYARASPPLGCSGWGAAFTACNAGKRSIAIDLKREEGRAVIRRLAEDADVLVESFRPGVMDRLGLGPKALLEQNPRLIYCSITGYGQNTHNAALAGHDINYQAACGLLSMQSSDGGARTQTVPPALLGDLLGGAFSAALSVMAALMERQHSGQGKRLDISMSHGAMALLPLAAVRHGNCQSPEPFGKGSLTGGNPAYSVYQAKDGRYVALGALEHKFWHRFCQHVGLDDLSDKPLDHDPAFCAEVRKRLEVVFKTRESREWAKLGAEWDVCLNLVQELDETLNWVTQDQVPLWNHYIHPQTQQQVHVLKGVTADLSEQERTLSPPPKQGQQTIEILTKAGFSAEQIANLQSLHVIATIDSNCS